MTRWARGNNAHKKQPEEATSWEDMWQGAANEKDQEENNESGSSKDCKKNVSKQDTTNLESEQHVIKCPKCFSNEHEEFQCKLRRPSEGTDEKKQQENGKLKLIESGSEGATSMDTLKSESGTHTVMCPKCGSNEHEEHRCRLKRPLHITSDSCYKCRGNHHYLECPALSEEDKLIICFKCGSTEHKIEKCKKDMPKDVMPFARCFICSQMGHISVHCPKNENGIYIKGGECHICKGKDHLSRNCPEKKKAIEEKQFFVKRQVDLSGSVEVEDEWYDYKKARKPSAKIVKFK